MKQIAKYKLFLGLFTLCWINSILPAFAAPDVCKPVYLLTVYEDFDNDNKADILTAVLSGNFCQITAHFKDHKQTIPIQIPEAATHDISIVTRDVNNNSYKDLVIVNKSTHKILSVILNCNGTFRPTRYNCISKDNFKPEIVQKKNSCSGSGSGEFSNNELPIQFIVNSLVNTPSNTIACCLKNICNNLNLRTIGFILPDKDIISCTSYLETDLPRGPPLL